MIIHGSEVLGPEHLAELSALFEKTWTAYRSSSDGEYYGEERARLACILLSLYRLRQLGPDQITQTALRLLRPSSPGQERDGIPVTAEGGEHEPVGLSTSAPTSAKVFGSGAG